MRPPSRDYYTTLARDLGLLSRAAFKLKFVQEKYNFIQRGDSVVILGSAPGGMTQLASRYVGKDGCVVAVDLKDQVKIAENVICLKLDVLSPDAVDRIRAVLKKGYADKLISDLSPDISGIREIDMARQLELLRATIDISDKVLRKGGDAYIKAFESPEVKEIEVELRKRFQVVRRIVPTATRKHSSEIFFLALKKL